MYVAVKGGETAILNSYQLLAQQRRGDTAHAELSVAQIQHQLKLSVDRVMTEGSVYDPELAALAIKQASGDLVIGGGVVGFNAAQMAVGLGADVTILDRDPEVLERLGIHFASRAKTRFSNRANIQQMICEADLVIGATNLFTDDAAVDERVSLPAVLLFDDGMHVRNHVARFGSAPRNLVFVAVAEDADQLVVGEQFESFVRRIVHERDFR